jgi:hypothetical protein
MKTLSRFLCVFLLAGPLWADSPGTSGGDLLKSPPGVRPAALADTYSSLGDDIYVIGFNPAGLTRISKFSVGLDHVQGLANIQTEALSVAIPTNKWGMLGVQMQYRHMPTIQNDLATDSPVKVGDYLLTLAAAHQWGRFSVGLSLKTLYSVLAEKHALADAIDIGGGMFWKGIQFSAVVQNLGPAVKYEPNANASDPLPMTFRLGASRTFIATRQAVLLGAVEADHVRDEGFQESLGVEYWHHTLIALRAGFRHGDSPSLSTGPTLGAAIRNGIGRVEYELGYAWRPSIVDSSYTLNNHLFGLLIWY